MLFTVDEMYFYRLNTINGIFGDITTTGKIKNPCRTTGIEVLCK